MLRGESCTVTERTLTCTLGNKFTVDLLIFRTASEHVLLTFFPSSSDCLTTVSCLCREPWWRCVLTQHNTDCNVGSVPHALLKNWNLLTLTLQLWSGQVMRLEGPQGKEMELLSDVIKGRTAEGHTAGGLYLFHTRGHSHSVMNMLVALV